jgi:hypothetical protein
VAFKRFLIKPDPVAGVVADVAPLAPAGTRMAFQVGSGRYFFAAPVKEEARMRHP